MTASKPVTAKQVQRITTDYETWLNAARDLLGRMADEPSARAIDAYVLLLHGDLRRLFEKVNAKERGA